MKRKEHVNLDEVEEALYIKEKQTEGRKTVTPAKWNIKNGRK
jgi:hypothetical protein